MRISLMKISQEQKLIGNPIGQLLFVMGKWCPTRDCPTRDCPTLD
jgi:hypothetical protein